MSRILFTTALFRPNDNWISYFTNSDKNVHIVEHQQVVSRLKWPERKTFSLVSFLAAAPCRSHPTSVYISSAGCWTVMANEHRHWKAGSRRTNECESELFTEKNISEVQNDWKDARAVHDGLGVRLLPRGRKLEKRNPSQGFSAQATACGQRSVGDSVKTHLKNVSAILKGRAGGQTCVCDGRVSYCSWSLQSCCRMKWNLIRSHWEPDTWIASDRPVNLPGAQSPFPIKGRDGESISCSLDTLPV